jgi:hypothetical protein
VTCACSAAQPCGYHAQLARDQAEAFRRGWQAWGGPDFHERIEREMNEAMDKAMSQALRWQPPNWPGLTQAGLELPDRRRNKPGGL